MAAESILGRAGTHYIGVISSKLCCSCFSSRSFSGITSKCLAQIQTSHSDFRHHRLAHFNSNKTRGCNWNLFKFSPISQNGVQRVRNRHLIHSELGDKHENVGNLKYYSDSSTSESSQVGALIDYLNASWTAFHATYEAKKQLLVAGFEELEESEAWDVKRGGKYFFTRNMSSIVAFAVGQKYSPGHGFLAIAAHTDSPCLKLKPISANQKHGFLTLGVQTYGGGLWYTWFDRDLSVAGRVLLRRLSDGRLEHRLVKVGRPILRVPTLAIHLDRTVNTDGFKPNPETHLAPLLSTKVKAELSGSQTADEGKAKGPHHSLLVKILAEELDCLPEEIVDFELNVCDTQPSVVGGASREFVFSGRLDNLASSFCALRALVDSTAGGASLEEETGIRLVALFDHEEVGSASAEGAGSPTFFQSMKRILSCLTKESTEEGLLQRSIQRSFLVSADMAHALHPNYAERHEESHQPRLHGGLVVKHNANQRYATTLVSSFLFTEVAKQAGIPTQRFVVRNDMGCGSTIGPILSSGVGIRTVDVGMPQLSMHSVREMCGTDDIDIGYHHFKEFFLRFSEIDAKLKIDGR